MRRLLSPLRAARIRKDFEQQGKRLAEQPVDVRQERFIAHVPPERPPGGYALLVFVPPWQDARVPVGWERVLDRSGVIFVSAARSGNDESALNRRAPLALLAAANMTLRYQVNPEQIYIGGFSGGSRVALRLALGYPDLFRGVILNAGSDPVGDSEIPLPPGDLLQKVQKSTRIVYLTGESDEPHLLDDMRSRQSLKGWCVFDQVTITVPRQGHEPAEPTALGRALHALSQRSPPDPSKLGACQAHIEAALHGDLAKVEAAFARHDSGATALLEQFDVRYGGLGGPRVLELAR